MNSINSEDLFSVYALWLDLNHAFLDNVEQNKHIHSSYTSPITSSCIDWMRELGEAIKRNDIKKAEKYLYNISIRSGEAIQSQNWNYKRGIQTASEDWMKPYYELSQIAIILTLKINPALMS